jgi:hypothetical protein
MAKMKESRHTKVLSTRPIFGQCPAAAVVGCVLLLATLLAAGCGQTTATPTAILPPVPLTWETLTFPPGNLLPGLNNLSPEWLSVAPTMARPPMPVPLPSRSRWVRPSGSPMIAPSTGRGSLPFRPWHSSSRTAGSFLMRSTQRSRSPNSPGHR